LAKVKNKKKKKKKKKGKNYRYPEGKKHFIQATFHESNVQIGWGGMQLAQANDMNQSASIITNAIQLSIIIPLY
jgi:hypothetical protein